VLSCLSDVIRGGDGVSADDVTVTPVSDVEDSSCSTHTGRSLDHCCPSQYAVADPTRRKPGAQVTSSRTSPKYGLEYVIVMSRLLVTGTHVAAIDTQNTYAAR